MTEHIEVDTVIIGAGPTGLGAATRLVYHNHTNWLLLEANPKPGGSANTDKTAEGFFFDQGGHVVFSHSKYFDELLATALPEDSWNVIERSTYVFMKDRLIPYPFQNNINALEIEDQLICLNGLVDATSRALIAQAKPASFDEWILRVMGEGIADMYMRPYNFKVWAHPTTLLTADWIGDPSVRPIDLKHCLGNILRGKRAPAPKVTFRYPKEGGNGAIWNGIANTLPDGKIMYGKKVLAIDLPKRTLFLNDGKMIKYKHCISTMPLDYTLKLVQKEHLASQLVHSSSHIVGIGMRGKMPHGKKCWFYYPEASCSFYRCSCISTYSKNNVPTPETLLPTLRVGSTVLEQPSEPKPGPYWSLMFEISESSMKPVNLTTIYDDTIREAIEVKLLTPETEIVSFFHSRISHGYPVPTITRDAVLAEALPFLKDHNFLSRGRFGGYKYEVSNQDHSVLIGAEAVDHVLFGTAEVTHTHPYLVGRSKNLDLTYASTPYSFNDDL